MIGGQENKLLELYLSNLDIICEGFPETINNRRRVAVENFVLTGLPGRKREDYRHSPVAALFEREWENYFIPTTAQIDEEQITDEAYKVNLINGFTDGSSQWIELECGAVVGSLKVAAQVMGDVVCEALGSLATDENEPMAALNTVFMQDGAFVFIPEGVKVEMPIVLNYNYTSQQEARMCFGRTLIVAQNGAKANIVVHHRTLTDDSFFVNYLREMVVGQQAEIELTELSEMNANSSAVYNCYSNQAGQSSMSAVNVWLGGELTRYNNKVELDGEESTNKLYALYAVTGNQRCDILNLVRHDAPLCSSFQQVKGVASGSAVGAFTGRVYVAEGAQKTEAIQQSRNLLLSDQARIYAEPQLEIYADDVKCGHGATVGQLDDDSIYYMRQRGISEADARRLQMQGFVNDIVMHCQSESVREYVRGAADQMIGDL